MGAVSRLTHRSTVGAHTAGVTDTLRLEPVERTRPGSPGLAQRQQRFAPWLAEPLVQWEFVVAGQRLHARANDVLGPDWHLQDEVSIADGAWPDYAVPLVQQLAAVELCEQEWTLVLEPGRFPLYVCPECADYGCGALTVHAERIDTPAGQQVVWSDFRYEDGMNDPADLPDMHALGPFTFAADDYASAFAGVLEQMRPMAERTMTAEAAWKQQRRPASRLRRLLGR